MIFYCPEMILQSVSNDAHHSGIETTNWKVASLVLSQFSGLRMVNLDCQLNDLETRKWHQEHLTTKSRNDKNHEWKANLSWWQTRKSWKKKVISLFRQLNQSGYEINDRLKEPEKEVDKKKNQFSRQEKEEQNKREVKRGRKKRGNSGRISYFCSNKKRRMREESTTKMRRQDKSSRNRRCLFRKTSSTKKKKRNDIRDAINWEDKDHLTAAKRETSWSLDFSFLRLLKTYVFRSTGRRRRLSFRNTWTGQNDPPKKVIKKDF